MSDLTMFLICTEARTSLQKRGTQKKEREREKKDVAARNNSVFDIIKTEPMCHQRRARYAASRFGMQKKKKNCI